jgi:hypothetical protein
VAKQIASKKITTTEEIPAALSAEMEKAWTEYQTVTGEAIATAADADGNIKPAAMRAVFARIIRGLEAPAPEK